MKKIFGLSCILILLMIAFWYFAQAGLLAAKAWAAPLLIEHAWEKNLMTGMDSPPWPWADSGPTAKISVPKLNLARYILQGDNVRNLAFGPVLQQTGSTTILFGHRDTHFRFLKQMEAGDIVYFQGSKLQREKWQVERTKVMFAENIYVSASDRGRSLMMITCYPFGTIDPGTDERFVVWLKQVENSA